MAEQKNLQQRLDEAFPIEDRDEDLYDLDQQLSAELDDAREMVSEGGQSRFDQLTDELADVSPPEADADLEVGAPGEGQPDLELGELEQPETGAEIAVDGAPDQEGARAELLRTELQERDQDEVEATIDTSVNRAGEAALAAVEQVREQVETRLDEVQALEGRRTAQPTPSVSDLYPPPLTRAGSLREGTGVS